MFPKACLNSNTRGADLYAGGWAAASPATLSSLACPHLMPYSFPLSQAALGAPRLLPSTTQEKQDWKVSPSIPRFEKKHTRPFAIRTQSGRRRLWGLLIGALCLICSLNIGASNSLFVSEQKAVTYQNLRNGMLGRHLEEKINLKTSYPAFLPLWNGRWRWPSGSVVQSRHRPNPDLLSLPSFPF